MNTESAQKSTLPWRQPQWLDDVHAWINDRLAHHGWRAVGSLEIIHQRPWSAFARLATDHGPVYFKAPAPTSAYEASLTEALARWQPDCTVPLLGVDPQRGWLLSAHAGDTLRSLTRSAGQLDHWFTILPLYSQLQIDMAIHVRELLTFGVPDRRLAHLPGIYARLLEDTDSLLLGRESGLTHDEYRRLQNLQSHFTEECRRLAAYGLPETLVHEEVHENNVLYGNGRYTFTDWSDCSVGHPFFTMLVTVRTLVHWLKIPEDSPEMSRVRDAYLEPWATFATRAELLEALALGERLAIVNRALSWRQGLAALPAEEKAEYADSVPGWLQDYLQAESADL
ncbi:MAG: phosphotransferase [Chloroflexota bacterium]